MKGTVVRSAAVVFVCCLLAATALAQVVREDGGCHARIYYVDPVSGNDHRCGTSPTTAWRTVARVNAQKLRPGDTVEFAGGEPVTWGAARGRLKDTVLAAQSGVTYTSYGSGMAIFQDLTPGGGSRRKADMIAFCGVHGVTITHLDFEGSRSSLNNPIAIESRERYPVCRGSTHIKIAWDLIRNWWEGVQASYLDSSWTIAHTTIDHTAGNGILFDRLNGRRNTGGRWLNVIDSSIINTGEHPPRGYAVHGIYDNAADSWVIGNVITNFSTDGVSVRFHGAQVRGNYIANGPVGIGAFEEDSVGGTTHFSANKILDTTSGEVFVCGKASGCKESLDRFVITNNTLMRKSGDEMDLQPTRGGYYLAHNTQESFQGTPGSPPSSPGSPPPSGGGLPLPLAKDASVSHW